ncbi:MAG TPA: hypothetical protein VHG10_14405, partial [Glycomyces sp.]|nr:hypothetical protein [Glycomyces sp.]
SERTELQISVEPAAAPPDGDRAPGWTEAATVTRAPEPFRAAACTHRVKVRELRSRGVLLWMLGVLMIVGTGFVALTAVFVGLEVFGSDPGVDLLLQSAVLAMTAGGVLSVVDVATLVRSWRRLHRPSLPMLAVSSVGTALLLLGVLILSFGIERFWLAAFAVPALVVNQLLWYLRSVLYGRSTCRTWPGLSARARTMLRHDPGPMAVRIAVERPDEFRIEDCPHQVKFREVRPVGQVIGVVYTVLYLAYTLGFWLLALDLLTNHDRLARGGVERWAIIGGLVAIALNVGGWLELKARSKRLHRASLGVYALAFAGCLGTGATAICVAVVLDRPIFYGEALLAIVMAHWAFSAMVALKPRSACRADPELPPKLQTILKARLDR